MGWGRGVLHKFVPLIAPIVRVLINYVRGRPIS